MVVVQSLVLPNPDSQNLQFFLFRPETGVAIQVGHLQVSGELVGAPYGGEDEDEDESEEDEDDVDELEDDEDEDEYEDDEDEGEDDDDDVIIEDDEEEEEDEDEDDDEEYEYDEDEEEGGSARFVGSIMTRDRVSGARDQ